MSNLIRLGVNIRQALEGSAGVVQIVGENLFAIAVPEKKSGVPYPHLTYTRSIDGRECLGNPDDTATITVMCWSENYDEVLDLAEEVCDALEAAGMPYENIQDVYEYPAFGQRITLTYKQ